MAMDRDGGNRGQTVILNIKWRCSLNAMWPSLRRFCLYDVLIRFPVR